MKNITRLLCLVLAAAMVVLTFAACADDKNKDNPADTSSKTTTAAGSGDVTGDPNGDDPQPDTRSEDEKIYDAALGEFYTAYAAAKEATNNSERFALMAIAEAKMMESAVMVPMQANGGNYAISKVAPYTITPVLWGTDNSRYHNAVLATTPILPEDRDALKALWADLKGTGTYEAAVKEYLTSHGYELQNTYTLAYTSDPDTFDLFLSQKAVNSDVLVNTYDGLAEYDGENVLQPALATSWEVSDDGLTWTFHLRDGVKWVDSTGAEIADLTADDFLAGFQHMLDDPEEGLSWLVDGIIVGVSEYLDEDAQGSFEDVGVKAVDDHTVQYTLTAPVSYFETMLGYGVFAPMNRAYYESLGGEFGFANGNWGEYGSDKDHIAYCGPYIITSFVPENTVVFEKNNSYWNKDNINLEKITWIRMDTSIATDSYDHFTEGVTDGCGLNSAALELAKADGNFEKYAYVASTDATSFPGFMNLNRKATANFNDENALVTVESQEEIDRANAAMQNQNFRLALALSLNRSAYLEQTVGAELKYTSLVNSYVPGTFVALEEDVTVKINGTDKSYKAGTWYGQIMQDQIDADGYPMKVFDPTAEGGVGSSGGYDGWYNPTEAVKYFEKAVEELAAAGVEISAEHPIHIEYPYINDGSTQTARANVVKNSFEEAFGGKVVVDLNGTTDQYEYLYATYYFATADQANYTLQLNSGWGPDFGDPSTYLDTMIKGGGYMLKCNGLIV